MADHLTAVTGLTDAVFNDRGSDFSLLLAWLGLSGGVRLESTWYVGY
jgi:hypothetical protein